MKLMPVVNKNEIPNVKGRGVGRSLYDYDIAQTLKLSPDQAWKLEHHDKKPLTVYVGATNAIKAKNLQGKIKVIVRGNDVFMYQV